jgi:glycosyltransferase involved in cell wall biosynthesis
LIAVSEQTKKEVMEKAPWFTSDKISVIPTVIPQHFKPRNGPPQNAKPIALHIGVADNKNLRRHTQALDGLGVHLRIIGQPNANDQHFLKQLDLECSWQSQLSDEEMQQAYGSSDFLLFCSTLEGFGMPILEAQMVGLPVITSSIEPMQGVAGAGAVLCNPLDVSGIRTAVEQMLDSDKLRAELIEKGHENARRFHPEEAVQAHIELYRKVSSMQRD